MRRVSLLRMPTSEIDGAEHSAAIAGELTRNKYFHFARLLGEKFAAMLQL